MNKTDKKFREWLFRDFGQDNNYDKITYRMLRCRRILSKNKVLAKLSEVDLYDVCITVFLIATQSERHAIRNFPSIFPKEHSEPLEYALEEGFKKVEPILI
ncbi:MAG: hypothetical protein ACOVQ4_12250 [Flectobacillus sp.]|uniref:hypothetical protein n=1 Tax=Flectobacillus sp. TaxID=50419 RepID=UPI003B9AC05A